MWHLISVCMLFYLLICLVRSSITSFLLVYYFSPFMPKHLTKHHRFVCFLTWLIDSDSTIDKVGGGDERTRSMSSVSTTKNCGGWNSSPTPPHSGGWKSSPTPLDNGNWGKNPKEFFGIFDTLIDRCTFVVWAVANSHNRNNWRSTSIKNYPKVLTTIAHFAKQPARDVYFVRQTHTSE